jgi:hypothetical protein
VIGDSTVAVARQGTARNNKRMVFSTRSAKQQMNSYRVTVFYVRSVPRCKQEIWSNELVVGQSAAGKNMSTEAEDIVEIRHQATAGEDTAD